MIRKILLGGASCFALLGAVDEAGAAVPYIDTTPGMATFTAPTTGLYDIDVWGAQGGGGYLPGLSGPGTTTKGGLGYGQRVQTSLVAGQSIYLYVGQQGQSATPGAFGGGGGGGGGSAALFTLGEALSGVVSGGGGGGGKYGGGINGQPATIGGYGANGVGVGAGYGGGFGSPGSFPGGATGAPGGGFGTNYSSPYSGTGFYLGGAGGPGFAYGGAGGSGFAGGGGAFIGGGGGGGASGGGGGGKYGGGGGGGGSYAFVGVNEHALTYKAGDGEIEIVAVPEPASWALLLGGFGFVGYVLRRRVMRAA
jgi:hypothetical protein